MTEHQHIWYADYLGDFDEDDQVFMAIMLHCTIDGCEERRRRVIPIYDHGTEEQAIEV